MKLFLSTRPDSQRQTSDTFILTSQRFSLSITFCLLACTNPSILMYARQLALTLFLIVFFGPYVFYIQCTTQQSHHRLNNSCHHAIFLLGLTSQTNQGHIAERKGLCSRQDHTLFVF